MKVFYHSIIAILLVIFLLPTSLFAETFSKINKNEDFDTTAYDNGEDAQLDKYLFVNPDNTISFDADKAKKDNLSFYTIEVGRKVESYAYNEIYPERGLFLPIYGNYCGPGRGTGSGTKIPIDDLDLACQHHDKCYMKYEDNQKYYCLCDLDLCREIKSKKANWTGNKRLVADGIEKYMYAQASNSIKTGRCPNQWYW